MHFKFDADNTACVAVFWGEGGSFCMGLKHASSLDDARALDPFDFPEDKTKSIRFIETGDYADLLLEVWNSLFGVISE